MKKSITTFFLIITVIALVQLPYLHSTALAASVPIKVLIDGKPLSIDVDPFAVEGRVLVPFRAIFEALGADVDWDNENQTAVGYKGLTYIFLQPGNKNALILIAQADFNDVITAENFQDAIESSKTVVLDVPPAVKDSRILVPTRFIAESLGAKVDWDSKTQSVVITTQLSGNNTPTVPQNPVTSPALNINSKIAGQWEFHFNQQALFATPMISASVHMKLIVNEDGTFNSNMQTTSGSSGGVTIMEGKYTIEGDKFVIFDGKKSYTPNIYEGNPNSAYKDIAVNNLKYDFSYNVEKDILIWNGWSFNRSK